MKLPFEDLSTSKNLLPYDGEVYYFNQIALSIPLDELYNSLFSTVNWANDKVTLFGKTITTNRKVALYADRTTSYTYSNQKKQAIPWIPELLKLKKIVEEISGEDFNCCLLNLYHDGTEGMGWHSDNEKILNPSSSIASLSLGAVRYFHFKHRETKEKLKFQLENGSLLLMKAPTQNHWLHALPKTKKITSGRINLTFRKLSII